MTIWVDDIDFDDRLVEVSLEKKIFFRSSVSGKLHFFKKAYRVEGIMFPLSVGYVTEEEHMVSVLTGEYQVCTADDIDSDLDDYFDDNI